MTAVIPGRAKREPGIHSHSSGRTASAANQLANRGMDSGLLATLGPGMTPQSNSGTLKSSQPGTSATS